MGPLRDARGLAVSTRDREALDRFEAALAGLHNGRGDTLALVDEALDCDPAFASGHCLRAAVLLLRSERLHERALRGAIDMIERCSDCANDRERRHAAAARAWLDGDAALALERYGELVIDYPRDTLALYVAHTLDFRLGRREALRDRVAQVLPHWHAGVPGFSYVLSMHAFGLEETGDYAQAREIAARALILEPDNAAAIHVIAHVLEMTGCAREGIAWLEATRQAWSANTGYAVHLAWHLALFHIDLAMTAAAVEIYDAMVAPSPSSPIAQLVDATALLWRLTLRGGDSRERWGRLAKCWRRRRLPGQRAFNLLHAAIAFAASGEMRLSRRISMLMMEDRATRRANTVDDLALAIPLTQALQAFVEEDYGRVVGMIKAVRAATQHCGGSVAQCDLIHLTLIEAALRCERAPLARALAAERTARKPQSPLNRWLFDRAEAMAGAA